MNGLRRLLNQAALHGRVLLIGGLVAGAALPEFAHLVRGLLPELVALLLFVAALRIGPRQAFGAIADLKPVLAAVLIFQVAVPIGVVYGLRLTDLPPALATALVLMTAASPISGSPNLTLLTGNDPAVSLRLLIVSTGLLPLTVLPVFWLTPALGSTEGVILATGRLLSLIALAVGAAFAIRAGPLREPAASTLRAVDGCSALLMAVLVIGLMSAVGPALRTNPEVLAINLIVAFAANFGLQIVTATALRGKRWRMSRAAFAIAAGNRNIALFLAALPSQVTGPLLVFIGCYQVPMYLTPLLLKRLYRQSPASGEQASKHGHGHE